MARAAKSTAPRGTRVPQQARSRRTRERILEAAVACFEQQGYDKTTTAEIARRARVAVGTLYGYFEDKRSILLELIQENMNAMADYVVRGLDPEAWRDTDPRESTRALIDAVFHTRNFNPGMQRIVWERFFKDHEIRHAMESIEGRLQGAIASLLEALKAEGHVRVNDVDMAAFMVQASLEWIANRLMLAGDAGNVDAAVEAASDLVTRFLFLGPEERRGSSA